MRKVLTVIFAAALLCSCSGDSLKTTYATQAEKIDNYVNAQIKAHPEYVAVYNEGVVRLTVSEGDGEVLAKGGRVTFTYVGYNFNSYNIGKSNIFATNDRDFAASSGWKLSDESVFEPVTITLGKDDLVKGLELGLEGIRGGEDCYIIFSGKYGFGRQLGTIPANAAICYRILADEVVN